MTINEPTEMLLSSLVSAAECNAFSETGSININLSGGTSPYTYSWSDGFTGEDRPTIGAGQYILEITDGNACLLTDTIKVGSAIKVDVNAGNDTTICYGESLILQGAGDYQPAWISSDFILDTSVLNPPIFPSMVCATTRSRSICGGANTSLDVLARHAKLPSL